MYSIDERETLIRYDEYDKCFYYSSNVRKHITHILKDESCFESVDKEIEDGKVIYVSAKLSDLDNFSVNPFVKTRRKLSEREKSILASRFRSTSDSKSPRKQGEIK
ncbi:hypothetical protein [Streptococcus suis]|uniref:Uncharacterized protein n=1 Tax=Streptococcus suis TaxID=1307 RepID=A0AAD0KW35_STRSU|nr:hypothetical protein [Streptococcus suis]AWX96424.1 hypothetical protein BKM66_09815 [Streptococcus suis]AWX98424.1 hypothetical protein BKM67_10355 [Streptococcus suis]MBS8056598.1 hypothetical protein [Streptococcus suis]MCL4942184.1 hypothetical protein [Streptococcus suis]HEM2802778.1 hypothetical protein [Streptococcus suis]